MIGFNNLGRLGQLGNQMFQYAVTLGVARYLGIAFTIPNHNEVLVDALGNNLRIELFDCFDIKPVNKGLLETDNIFVERGFEFDKNIFNIDKREDWILNGFFQSEKYFKDIEDEIRNDFTFKDDILKPCKEMMNQIGDYSIALHIRRGDFLINSGNHHNLSLDYYEKALKHFDKRRQVIIFSDDPVWCKEQKLFENDRFLVSEGNDSYTDLCLMSLCSDFIIANSTFSWWGAWLSENKNKDVVAPKIWFGSNNSHLSTKDLYPKGWVIV